MRHPFLRTLAGAAVTPTTDSDFENVTLLLHGDGTNGAQNNTFVDGSTNNFTITRSGGATQGTFSPYGNNWSNYFEYSYTSFSADGTTSSGNFAANTDFTIEFWWRSQLVNSGTGLVVGKTLLQSNSSDNWFVDIDGSSYKLKFVGHSGNSTFTPVTSTTTVMDAKWHHCAITRSGTTYRIFIDGSLEQTATNSSTINTATSYNVTFPGCTTIVGENYGAVGYISNLRIIVGTCQYSSAFTPSTTPLTSVTNTVLLTCQSARVVDNGPNAYTLSIQQASRSRPQVQRLSPFAPAAAYASSTIGGSAYFDGTYLTVSDNAAFDIGSGAFTMEAWVYLKENKNYHLLLGQWYGGYGLRQAPTTFYPEFMYTTNGSNETVALAGTSALPLFRWFHIAVSRNTTNTFSLFLDGKRIATTSSFTATIYNSTTEFKIGAETSSILVNCYVCDARLVKGTAVYDPTQTTLTLPTAPLTAVTNTSLLCNFTNAGVVDNAMACNPETVGNAQIDTTTKKFGTGSLKFDGTGDWLYFPDYPDQRLGTGNFTIECWIYLAATGAARGIVGKGSSTTGWLLSTDSSNKVVFTYGSSTITSTGALSGSTWYHLAVVREGTGTNQTKIYIGGTNDGTGTVSTDFNQTNAGYVGANRTGGDALNGYIDDLRITKGVARYTANFTAPTAAFPDL